MYFPFFKTIETGFMKAVCVIAKIDPNAVAALTKLLCYHALLSLNQSNQRPKNPFPMPYEDGRKSG